MDSWRRRRIERELDDWAAERDAEAAGGILFAILFAVWFVIKTAAKIIWWLLKLVWRLLVKAYIGLGMLFAWLGGKIRKARKERRFRSKFQYDETYGTYHMSQPLASKGGAAPKQAEGAPNPEDEVVDAEIIDDSETPDNAYETKVPVLSVE